jgi:hypothetical protein
MRVGAVWGAPRKAWGSFLTTTVTPTNLEAGHSKYRLKLRCEHLMRFVASQHGPS